MSIAQHVFHHPFNSEDMATIDLEAYYVQSPLIKVPSSIAGTRNVYLKLENMQPSGSFKDRGISHMVSTIMKTQKVSKLVSSSGGNAGHAVATVGQKLGIPVDVFVPTIAKPVMISKLKKKGANVTLHGANWNEADALARKALQEDPEAIYIPPFDDWRIWDGNSTIVDELAAAGVVPDKIVLSVGGGGLLAGVQRGVLRHGWQDRTKIIASETEGTASFARSFEAGKPVNIAAVTSIASSLGALSVVPECLNSGVDTIPYTVSDYASLVACRRFLDDFRMLVEPACGTALSYLYCPMRDEDCVSPAATVNAQETVVIIVCGGSAVTIEMMSQWCTDFGVTSEYA